MITKEELTELYINQNISEHKIAKLYSCSRKAIDTRLKKYGLKKEYIPCKYDIDKDDLYRFYYVEGKTIRQICSIYGCSPTPIIQAMDKHEFKRREKGETGNVFTLDKDTLYDIYINQKKSCKSIGDMYGVSQSTVVRLLKYYDIERRKCYENSTLPDRYRGKTIDNCQELRNKGKSISESRKKGFASGKIKGRTGVALSLDTKRKISSANKGKMSGKNNPNWKGGVTKEYYLWRSGIDNSLEYKEFRKNIYERDDYCCQMCSNQSNEDIQVHHIKEVHKHPELMMEERNCITLCKKCHSSIRWHEEEHEDNFTEIVQAKYDDKSKGVG